MNRCRLLAAASVSAFAMAIAAAPFVAQPAQYGARLCLQMLYP